MSRNEVDETNNATLFSLPFFEKATNYTNLLIYSNSFLQIIQVAVVQLTLVQAMDIVTVKTIRRNVTVILGTQATLVRIKVGNIKSSLQSMAQHHKSSRNIIVN